MKTAESKDYSTVMTLRRRPCSLKCINKEQMGYYKLIIEFEINMRNLTNDITLFESFAHCMSGKIIYFG